MKSNEIRVPRQRTPGRRGREGAGLIDLVTRDEIDGPAEEFPLPALKHLPGINRRPDDGFLDAVIRRVPVETRADDAATNVVWHYGIRLINAGYFWEAHEVLEPVWWNAAPNSRERFLVQGVIHLANAVLKVRMGRGKAANRLAKLGNDCFDRAFTDDGGRFMGIDAAEAFAAVAAIRQGRDSITLSSDYAL